MIDKRIKQLFVHSEGFDNKCYIVIMRIVQISYNSEKKSRKFNISDFEISLDIKLWSKTLFPSKKLERKFSIVFLDEVIIYFITVRLTNKFIDLTESSR